MNYEVRLSGLASVPQPNIDALLRVHTGLAYEQGMLVGEAQIPEDYLAQDITFALKNSIPAENTASRLETYTPRNVTQVDLLDKARFLAQARGRFMGLVALGDPGVGKSHIAIGLAKALEITGQTSRYIHVPSAALFLSNEVRQDETLIIDDLNNPFGWGRQNFSKVVTRMHHNGSGRLFITSNVAPNDYNQFLLNLIGSNGHNDPELLRIADRAGVALRVVPVQGESYRRSQTEDPWADYRPSDSAYPLEG